MPPSSRAVGGGGWPFAKMTHCNHSFLHVSPFPAQGFLSVLPCEILSINDLRKFSSVRILGKRTDRTLHKSLIINISHVCTDRRQG
jgi:hypothetical protein